MTPATNLGCSGNFSTIFKYLVIWGLVVGGLVHQFLMYFFEIEKIPVFVNPPGDIYPLVSLEYEWWIVLLLVSSLICVSAYSDRLKSIPTRLALPFYIYIVFLLISVKPV